MCRLLLRRGKMNVLLWMLGRERTLCSSFGGRIKHESGSQCGSGVWILGVVLLRGCEEVG